MRIIPLLILAGLAVAADRTPRVTIGDSDGAWDFPGANDPASFGELDGNGDGKVSSTEWKAGREQLMRAIKETRAAALDAHDRDDSGKLSRVEAAEAKPRFASLWQQTRALALAANDADGDGKLTGKEVDPLVTRAGHLFARVGARVDADHNRTLTPSEVETAVRAVIEGRRTLFSICDVNNDGQLSQREAAIAFDLLPALAGP